VPVAVLAAASVVVLSVFVDVAALDVERGQQREGLTTHRLFDQLGLSQLRLALVWQLSRGTGKVWAAGSDDRSIWRR
jgi:hypothetical protein